MGLKIKISTFLICLTTLVFAQPALPTNEQLQKIVNRDLNLPSTFGGLSNTNNVTYKTIILQLKTNNYYKELVDNGVLKIVSQNNATYTYDISDLYKKLYVVNIDKIKFTAQVKTLVLSDLYANDPKLNANNEPSFWIESQYRCTPFYDPVKYPGGTDPGGKIITNIKLTYQNGGWKLKYPEPLKKQIRDLDDRLSPERNTFLQIRNNEVAGGWKKEGNDGIEYKIIPKGSGEMISYGKYIEYHMKQLYGGAKDTILMDTREFMPRFDIIHTNMPVAYQNMLFKLRKGDSIIIRQLVSNVFKDHEQIPPYMKKENYSYTTLKIINVFETQSEMDIVLKKESALAKPKIYANELEAVKKNVASNKIKIESDGEIILEYLRKHNIKAEKTEWGTYISIQSEGMGDKINNASVVTVNYTGKNLDGEVFASSILPGINHVDPLQVTTSHFGNVITGWSDAILHMKKGTKATIYIPSSLGYGTTGNLPSIKPNAILVFDIEITEVTPEID
jgi:FKBP-type peptidyl-prolyl cis-trans isomerase